MGGKVTFACDRGVGVYLRWLHVSANQCSTTRNSMSSVPTKRYTPQEYLELERKAEVKSEYYRGEIFAMSGASEEHNLIAANLLGLLWNQLRGRPFET